MVRALRAQGWASVDLIGALSHPSPQVERLLGLHNKPPAALSRNATQPSRSRTARQLSELDIDQLVEAYQTGATVYHLAKRFSIHRVTVGKHLRARGIDTTPPALSPDDVHQAAELYQSGWSLTRIAEKYEVAAETVRAQLRAAGVVMRKAWER